MNVFSLFFFFNVTATTEIYTLSLHDALPISRGPAPRGRPGPARARRSAPLVLPRRQGPGRVRPRHSPRVRLVGNRSGRLVRRHGDALPLAPSQRPLDELEERRLVVLHVEPRGEADRVAGVEAHVLGHALAEGLPRRVPRQLEERDALLGGDARAPAHELVD